MKFRLIVELTRYTDAESHERQPFGKTSTDPWFEQRFPLARDGKSIILRRYEFSIYLKIENILESLRGSPRFVNEMIHLSFYRSHIIQPFLRGQTRGSEFHTVIYFNEENNTKKISKPLIKKESVDLFLKAYDTNKNVKTNYCDRRI